MRRCEDDIANEVTIFQSTHHEWAATVVIAFFRKLYFNFNPRSPSGLRQLPVIVLLPPTTLFQSTHSIRSATYPGRLVYMFCAFQSTHSIRSATVQFQNHCTKAFCPTRCEAAFSYLPKPHSRVILKPVSLSSAPV